MLIQTDKGSEIHSSAVCVCVCGASFVLSSEVVPISEVHHVLIIKQGNKYK